MRRLVWLLALAACGGDDSGGGDDGGGGGPDASVPSNNGFVQLSAYNAVASATPIVGGSASASFVTTAATSSCTQHTVGACDVYVCSTTTPTQSYASDGTITITGLAQAVTLTPQSNNMYAPFSTQQAPLFSGGETVTLHGTGGTAPAFTLMVTMPSRATITSPTKPAGTSGSVTIQRSQDFSASWTGGGAGKLYLYVSGPSGSGATVSCGFDASAGTGKIPAAALSMLPAGMGSFSAASLAVKTLDMTDWRIYGQGFFNAVWAADTSMAAATATLQ